MRALTGSGRIVIVIVCLVPLLRASGSADRVRECTERAYAQDVAAKQDWHRGVRELVAQARPDLATVATLQMEQQLALVNRRQAEFNYLIGANPKRIRTGEGLATFRNFDWTESDALVLRRQSQSYATLANRIADLESQTKSRSDWPALQEYSRTILAGSPQFQRLLETLQVRESGIERLLRTCQP
jgi:hypothetical protein